MWYDAFRGWKEENERNAAMSKLNADQKENRLAQVKELPFRYKVEKLVNGLTVDDAGVVKKKVHCHKRANAPPSPKFQTLRRP